MGSLQTLKSVFTGDEIGTLLTFFQNETMAPMQMAKVELIPAQPNPRAWS